MTCQPCLEGSHWKCRGCDCRAKEFHQRRKARAEARNEPIDTEPVAGPKVKKPRRSYSSEQVTAAAELRASGHTWPQIAEALDVPVEGIRYALNAYGPEVPKIKTPEEKRLEELSIGVIAACRILRTQPEKTTDALTALYSAMERAGVRI